MNLIGPTCNFSNQDFTGFAGPLDRIAAAIEAHQSKQGVVAQSVDVELPSLDDLRLQRVAQLVRTGGLLLENPFIIGRG
jgi:hypothetical protein